MLCCPKLKIKRKNPSVEKLYRITQTEKKPKATAQLTRYQPLTQVFQNYSAAKQKCGDNYNRVLSSREETFINNPNIQFVDKTDETVKEDEKYFGEQGVKFKVNVTFGDISESTQGEFIKIIDNTELMNDTLIKYQQQV